MLIQRFIAYVSIFIGLFILAGLAQAQQAPAAGSPNNSLFNNGVRSPADFASLPARAGAVSGQGAPAQTFFFSDDLSRLPDLRHYRVVSSSTVPASARPRIVGPELEMPALGTAPKRPYLRLAVVSGELEARQFIQDFFESNKQFIDANFVLRTVRQAKGKPLFVVDMGPFVSDRHARLFCVGVLKRGLSEDKACDTAREFQSRGERNAFQGKATVGLSMAMVQQVMASNKQLDFPTLYGASIDIQEGDSLGRSDHMVVKVTRRGLFLAREDGTSFLLPADTIPMPMPGEYIDTAAPAGQGGAGSTGATGTTGTSGAR
jgi:hypothetical protein